MCMSRRINIIVDTLLIFTFGLVFIYAKWWAWHGGQYWGSRFFLIGCVPAYLIIAHTLLQRLSIWSASALLLSVWGCYQGYLYGLAGTDLCFTNDYQLEALCWYTPEFSPLWRPFVSGFGPIKSLPAAFLIWGTLSIVFVLYRAMVATQMNPDHPLPAANTKNRLPRNVATIEQSVAIRKPIA